MGNIEAYPLCWPPGWPRTKFQKRARFSSSFAKARDEIFHELRLLGATNVILSTNIPLNRNGLPYAGQSEPGDCAVAVYFKYKNKSMVFASDTWNRVTDNLVAIQKTINAIRGIERWSASSMLERAFTGFTALPGSTDNWWDILGVDKSSDEEQIKTAYRNKCRKHHPDFGGSNEMMSKINKAYDQGIKK